MVNNINYASNYCFIGDNPPASLYVHVPFCVRKCDYCDFISFSYNSGDAERYAAGLKREIELIEIELINVGYEKNLSMSTVFIGGGTPTCLSLELILEIIKLIKSSFSLSDNTEFTVEANPGTIDRQKLQSLYRAGVNRLSIGAQAFDTKTLNILGRIHTVEQTVDAVRAARAAGFDNINLDLIFGAPGQSPADWRHCLEQAIELQPEHIAAYGLQIEEGTRLKRRLERGELSLCAEDDQIQMYEDTAALLEQAGLKKYEISNYARPGRECRHNLVYWHNGEYIGLGPAAHSRIKNKRYANTEQLNLYLSRLAEGLPPAAWEETVTPENDAFETIFLGLRLSAGLNLAWFKARFGYSLDDRYPGVARRLIEQGFLEEAEGSLRLTSRGVNVSNMVMSEFVPPITCLRTACKTPPS
ncbi:oxygen-independent coproporphyrinogen-3 oxidase [Desulfotomaculum arcticum]|uniref:Coproporphyrinogen-III oxidase n=1 Tax=Desulfotruncus arcticus DSM 17038 TaxID=1121424 RepID=A0A1I2XJN3_9FIRM|nr:radical SAM family heme chaperone HemW [Desulfotruncus arcticus]SFH12906.1 oxygen-independent coproporphyrinogen-3 oxidase [Desulfotomaculum arcticum] [Desulfotruncus arcticus DSM 17038]